MGHEDAVYLAKLAEQAERYEGMYTWMPGNPHGSRLTLHPACRDGREHEDRRL